MLRRILQRRRDARPPDDRGQMLVLFAAGLVAFCGLVGMSIDIGQIVTTKADLQKVVDAAALAGAQDLPLQNPAVTSTSTAQATALSYADLNADDTTTTVQFLSTINPNDQIKVSATRHVEYTFLKVLGFSGKEVTATAKVRVGVYNGGAGIVPWGLVASSSKDFLGNSCFNGWESSGMPKFKTGQLCTLKYGAGENSGGDFGALALDGSGGSAYRDDIAHGSSNTFVKGQKVEVQTGNMQGPTGQGISDRLSQPLPATCQTNVQSQIIKLNADGSASIVPGCENHPRIMIIPVVDKIANPAKSTILGFAYTYLVQVSGGGGHSSVQVQFVKFENAIPNASYTGSGQGSTAAFLIE